MELLTNSRYDVVGLDGYGLHIAGTRRIPVEEA
jgi:GTP cyclohydrolase II